MSNWIVWSMLCGLLFGHGCSFYRSPLHEQRFELGRFVFREAASGHQGFVVGAPHGETDLGSDRLARTISDRTGAGLVIATGFKKNRLGVNRPLARSYGSFDVTPEALRAASVYQDFKKIVSAAAVGNLEFYIGIHTVASPSSIRLEVIASGFSFEEAAAIKRSRPVYGRTGEATQLSYWTGCCHCKGVYADGSRRLENQRQSADGTDFFTGRF